MFPKKSDSMYETKMHPESNSGPNQTRLKDKMDPEQK